MDNNTILKAVIDYRNSDTARFHMPGHKGRPVGLPFDCALEYDLTEIDSTGNLLDPSKGDVTDSTLEYMKQVYGTSATVMSAGGATLALQGAILASVRRSGVKTIICSRHIHRSAVYAMALCGAEPLWMTGDTIPDAKAAAALVTSPDYYGRMCDIAAISQLCEKRKIPLIVDCAHGSHLRWWQKGSLHPTKLGAALTVDSPHKTLPAMTGCALLHSMPFGGECFGEEELLSAMRDFSSTSPSYILQCSLCRCVEFMDENGTELLKKLYAKLGEVRRKIRAMGYSVPDTDDPFRLCIVDANSRDLEALLAGSGVVVEFADAENVVLIPSVMNTEADFLRLTSALENALESGFVPSEPMSDGRIPKIPESAMPIRDAVMTRHVTLSTSEAVGRICAEPVTPYPPGVPVVMPGEVIDRDTAEFILSRNITQVRVCM